MYVNQIIAPLTSKLRLETVRQLSAVTGETSVYINNVSTKVRVGGGNEVEIGLLTSKAKVSML